MFVCNYSDCVGCFDCFGYLLLLVFYEKNCEWFGICVDDVIGYCVGDYVFDCVYGIGYWVGILVVVYCVYYFLFVFCCDYGLFVVKGVWY